jgi:hypothetical protein
MSLVEKGPQLSRLDKRSHSRKYLAMMRPALAVMSGSTVNTPE